ncbi:MAG TPA: NAD-dependent epimerase/dehydratase family protein [Polyangiales bacterium]|nr:NAD-dependent epimerase/dehydratase family protein [Polyangiales bacterium]
MRVALYGATGMIGSGVLRECLLDQDVQEVIAIGRRPNGKSDPKLRDLILPNLLDYASVQGELVGLDACFFCLGISSVGLDEQAYTEITYEYALAAAHALLVHNPNLTFVFISGANADSTERGRVMWARVKGKAENALLALPFKAVFVFRPAFVQPLHGISSRTTGYNVLYRIISPLVPVIRWAFPKYVTTTERVGRAMLRVAKQGAAQRLFENWEIDQLGR